MLACQRVVLIVAVLCWNTLGQVAPIVHYELDGNALDSSGNGIDGVIVGDVMPAEGYDGTPGGALAFDGAGDYIVADASLLPTGERTVALWMRADGVPTNGVPVGYGGGACGTSWFQWITASSGFGVSSHCGVNTLVATNPTLTPDVWTHWAITTNGAGTRIYIDGVLAATSPNFVQNTSVQGKDLSIAVAPSASGFAPYTDVNIGYFDGVIDDVRIYDVALDQEEVEQLARVPELWAKEDGVLLTTGEVGGPDELLVGAPEVLRLPDTSYRMYYLGQPSSGPPSSVLSATSVDGTTWVKEAGVRLTAGGSDATTAIGEVSVARLPGGAWRMYYLGLSGGHWEIYAAYSEDGLSWAKEQRVLSISSSGPDSFHLGSPNVVQVDTGWRLYYTGSTSSCCTNGTVLSAVSPDGLTWAKESGVRLEPLDPDLYGHPTTRTLPQGGLRMYFTSREAGSGITDIISATSSDGLGWSLDPGVRIAVGSPGDPDAAQVSTPTVFDSPEGGQRIAYLGISGTLEPSFLSAVYPAPDEDAGWEPDCAFGIDGLVTSSFGGGATLSSLVLQSDGKIVAGGTRAGSVVLARFEPDGTPDETFGTGGRVVGPPGNAVDMAMQSDGSVLVSLGGAFSVIRFSPDGVQDLSFGSGGLASSAAFVNPSSSALAVASDDSMTIAGRCCGVGFGAPKAAAVRYDASGSELCSIQNGGPGSFTATLIQTSELSVLAGRTQGINSSDILLQRLASNCVSDPTFGCTTPPCSGVVVYDGGFQFDRAEAVAELPDGSLVFVGNVAIKTDANGILDQSFGGTGVVDLGMFTDSIDVSAGGFFVNGGPNLGVRRFTYDGWADESFGESGLLTTTLSSSPTTEVAVTSDGGVIAAGTEAGEFVLVRYISMCLWDDLGQALTGSSGDPTLAGVGSLVDNTPVKLVLDNALENTTATLVIGLSPLNAPFKQGVLVPSPSLVLAGLPTGAAGSIDIDSTWPSGIPPGFTTYYQFWITDPIGPKGFAASNGLRSTVP